MPTFDTPQPITLALSVLTADVRVRAADRPDTVLTVRPGHPDEEEDVEAAAKTRVELVDGRLEVRAPRPLRRFSPRRTGGAITVDVDLPTGSAVEIDASMADVRTEGRLGACRLAASMGSYTLEETGPLRASTYGDVTVGHVDGTAEVTGGRVVRVERVEGDAEVRNQNGDIRVGEVTGSLRARTANGSVTVDRAGERVEIRSASGDVRVGAVVAGEVSLQTAHGSVEVGIAPGTAAHLDAQTQYGRLRNELDAAEGPGESERTALVRAHTSFGDVVVTRPDTAREQA